MKIKTITCHDVYNFGASLQAFALMKFLQYLNHEVEIIDYMPDYMKYNIWAIGDKWKKNIILRLIFYMYIIPVRLLLASRRRKFDIFSAEMLSITSRRYHSFNELKNNPPIADIYFAGSDQIWNTSHMHGKDPAFFLDFVPNELGAVRTSYAASFSISKLPDEYKDFVRVNLEKFNAISVRENSGIKILESIGINDGIVVLDPVFLLEKKYWDRLAMMRNNEKYILIYDQENNSIIKETAKKIAKSTKMKIYAIQSLYPMYYANKKLTNIGPLDFLNLIKNSEVCLTNSFHCTAFSLIFQKEFFTFKRTHEKVNSRMVDLLETVKLNDRIIESPDEIKYIEKIDYQKVNKFLAKEIQLSKEFIDRILEFARNNDKEK